jgi:hypothetical protein
VKHLISRLILFTGLIALFPGCDHRESIFDYYADPVLPPLSFVESGTYDHVLNNVYLDKADNSDSRIYYTYDPDLPYTDLGQWIDYYATVQTGFTVNVSTTMRTFSYESPTRFSEVKTLAWELKCPQAGFNIPPGAVNHSPADVWIYRPTDMNNSEAFTVWYTTDNSDPGDVSNLSRFTILSGTNDALCGNISGVGSFLTVRALTQRAGWTNSDSVNATFTIEPISAGFTFTLNLPDGTTVGFTGQSPVLSPNQSMTVNAQPTGMAEYHWSLNGQECVYAASGDPFIGTSVTLGGALSSPPATPLLAGTYALSALAPGGYNLSCIAVDANGYMYSKSISFAVTN